MRSFIRFASALLLAPVFAMQAQVAGLTGTLVVTNKSPSTASIIDVASGRLLATLPTGRGPHEIVLSSDGRMAVVTDYGTGQSPSLTVINVPGLAIARTIPLGQYRAPHGIVFLPGDSLVAVTSEATNNLVIVNVVSGEIRRAIDTKHPGSHMVGVTASGFMAYTGDMRSNTVSELDLRTGAFTRSWEVPTTPEAINVTPDGSEVWVGSNATGKVSVLDPKTGTLRTAAEGVQWPYRVLFTPDVKVAIIPDMGKDEVRFLDRASHRELSRIALPGAGPQGVTLTSDGRYLLLSLSKQAKVAIIDLRTRQVVGHVDAGQTPDGVVYSRQAISAPR
jgi:DNA-binding beta-propeller fold protein YncE